MTIGGVPPQLINHGLLSRGCHYPIKISQRSCDGDLMITECKKRAGISIRFLWCRMRPIPSMEFVSWDDEIPNGKT